MQKIKNAFNIFGKNVLKIIKFFPWYGYVSIVIAIGSMVSFYYVGRAITAAVYGPSRCIIPSIKIDDKIPLVPYFFIQIYVLCYPIWGLLPLLACKYTKRRDLINSLFVFELSFVVSMIIFIAYPTLMDRTLDPRLSGLMSNPDKYKGFSYWLLKLVIKNDGGQYNYSPLPSVHCVMMLCTYLCIAGKKEVPLWIRLSTSIFTVLCLSSTIFTKQHYFMDMVYGTIIPVGVYGLVYLINPGKLIENTLAKKDPPPFKLNKLIAQGI